MYIALFHTHFARESGLPSFPILPTYKVIFLYYSFKTSAVINGTCTIFFKYDHLRTQKKSFLNHTSRTNFRLPAVFSLENTAGLGILENAARDLQCKPCVRTGSKWLDWCQERLQQGLCCLNREHLCPLICTVGVQIRQIPIKLFQTPFICWE